MADINEELQKVYHLLLEEKHYDFEQYRKKILLATLKNKKKEIIRKKKRRSFIRRNVEKFYRKIFIKGYSDQKESDLIIEFLEFYKENWKIQDFKIENFTNQKNETDIKNYRKLLEVSQKFLSDNS